MHLRISLKNAQHECHEDLIIVALLCGLISCLKHKKTFLKPFHSFQFFFSLRKLLSASRIGLILSAGKMVPLFHLLPLADSSVLVLSRVRGAAVTNRDNDKHPSPSPGARGLLQGPFMRRDGLSIHCSCW